MSNELSLTKAFCFLILLMVEVHFVESRSAFDIGHSTYFFLNSSNVL